VPAVCGEQTVGRTERDRVTPFTGGAFHKLAQRRRVAESIAAVAPKRIKLNAKTPQPFARCDVLDRDAALRRDRKPDLTVAEAQLVIAGRGDGRHHRTAILRAQTDRLRFAAFEHEFGGILVG
jgi:hypothetical protein